MPRLIHLNGPPGIGKSTVARVFADRHPGVLNLDIDRVTAMIGGWTDRFSDSFDAGRLLAAAMAQVHLARGHDVVMPQMMTNVNAGELACFETAAAVTGAGYCQILLTARVESAVDRCLERARGGDPGHAVVSKVIDDNGGPDFLRKLHAQVTRFGDPGAYGAAHAPELRIAPRRQPGALRWQDQPMTRKAAGQQHPAGPID